MANLFLTGSGVPTNLIGEISDYYRDTATNLIYYRASTGWEAVPSLIPTPDGVGTTWLFGEGAPGGGIGSTNDYYRDDTNGSVYRKHAVNGWEALGSLDFIGVYGVQWGEGTGAPANTEPLNNLPAGSFYLDVATSNIYYKDNTLTWSLKGQLGGGGGGGGGSGGSVTVVDALNSTSATDALSANQGRILDEAIQDKADLDSPALITPTATTHPDTNDSSLRLATTQMVQGVGAAAKAYADNLVLGLLDDRGNYDLTDTSLYPTTGGSGASGAILKGDLWAISADGNVNGIAVTVGDTIRALADSPAQNNANWAITQNNLIYVPENSSNKATSLSLPDNTKYPTTQAVATELSGYLTTINAGNTYATKAGQRYQFLNDGTTINTTYTVPASAVTENGRTIIELSNNSLTSITVDTDTGAGKISGDSVNISITGTYAAQELFGSGVTLQGDLTFSYQHQTKTLIYKGSNIWKIVG